MNSFSRMVGLFAVVWWWSLLMGPMPAAERTPAQAPASARATTQVAGVRHSAPIGQAGAEPAALDATPALDGKHRLAIGDRLSFRIVEDQEDPTEPREPKTLTVADSGELEIPYIGRFPAEGKTCKELAAELKGELEKEYYYQATVILSVDLMAKTRGKVYLVGPVRLPGPQDIPSDEILTLSKAIMRAGGFTELADRHKVKVTRQAGASEGETKSFVVDVAEIVEKGRVEQDLPLEPGDLIWVPERVFRF